MSAFRFRLESLLKLREADRLQRRSELAEAYEAASALRQQVEQLGAEIEVVKKQARAVGAGGRVNVDHLIKTERYRLVLQSRSAVLQNQKARIAAWKSTGVVKHWSRRIDKSEY